MNIYPQEHVLVTNKTLPILGSHLYHRSQVKLHMMHQPHSLRGGLIVFHRSEGSSQVSEVMLKLKAYYHSSFFLQWGNLYKYPHFIGLPECDNTAENKPPLVMQQYRIHILD